MELQLRNIGMIEEANVKIDGLTVIAGENDTGKSTVGKALYLLLVSKDEEKRKLIYKSLFEQTIGQGTISLVEKNELIKLECSYMDIKESQDSTQFNKYMSYYPIFIETPIVWSLIDFFRDISQVESHIGIKLDYPYLLKDLAFILSLKSSIHDSLKNIQEKLIKLIGGEFKKDKLGKFYFDKKDIGRVEIVNTATGIKSFGILQVLSQNGWLGKYTILILDEPEVHLHPKWQLEMAKVIVELVKNGVKVLVNSHSPYMIEALKRYSETGGQENKTNFYLAKDGYIKQINDSNSETLSEIFEKLSEPFDVFDEMDSDRLGELING